MSRGKYSRAVLSPFDSAHALSRNRCALERDALNLVRPLPRAMLDEEDLDLGVRHPVGDDVRRARDDQFARTLDLSGAANEGIGGKQLPRLRVDFIDDTCRRTWAVFSDVVADRLKFAPISSGPD